MTLIMSHSRQYNLVPIAAEDYGDMTATYKVVAAARKRDLYMTLFNLKRMAITYTHILICIAHPGASRILGLEFVVKSISLLNSKIWYVK